MTDYFQHKFTSPNEARKHRDEQNHLLRERLLQCVTHCTSSEEAGAIYACLLGETPPNIALASNISARAAIADDCLTQLSETWDSGPETEFGLLTVRDGRWATSFENPIVEQKTLRRKVTPLVKKAFPNAIGLTRIRVRPTSSDELRMEYQFGALVWGHKLHRNAEAAIDKYARTFQRIDGEGPVALARITTPEDLTAAVYTVFDITTRTCSTPLKVKKSGKIGKTEFRRLLIELRVLDVLATCPFKALSFDSGEGQAILRGATTSNDVRIRNRKGAAPIHRDFILHEQVRIGRQIWREKYELPRVLYR